jgi:hypothetical protein
VDGFVAPHSVRLRQRQSTNLAHTTLRACHIETSIQADESLHEINKTNKFRPHVPILMFLAALSSLFSKSPRSKTPAPLLAASTLVASPATSITPLRFIFAACLILVQQHGLHFLQFTALLLKQFSSFYLFHLANSPCITKSITSGVIGICGDYAAQWLDYKLKRRGKSQRKQYSIKERLSIHGNYDFRRGLAIMTDGFFISGPLMHLGYDMFENILPVGTSSSAALAHVVADSIILDSTFVATAFIVTGLMEGYGLRRHIIPQFKKDYFPALRASWATSFLLMPLEFVSFRFLPVTFRTLAMNLTDVFWDTIVSFMTHRHRKMEDRIQSVSVAMTDMVATS